MRLCALIGKAAFECNLEDFARIFGRVPAKYVPHPIEFGFALTHNSSHILPAGNANANGSLVQIWAKQDSP